ncbi:single-stranded DNA-binding protein [Ekhidna sp.]
MQVQFTARIATEITTREVPSENGNFNATEFSVAESGKDKVFHQVNFTGSDKVLPYLEKGKLIEIVGDMAYSLSKEDDQGKQHKYYRINTKRITLLSSGSNQEEAKDDEEKA